MRSLCFIASLVAVVVWWAREHQMNSVLRAQIELARQDSAESASLLRERERLQRLQGAADQRRIDESAAAVAGAKAKPSPAEAAAQRSAASPLILGEWLPLAAWENRGQATPMATVETALWAAAGGHIEALKNLLQLDEAVRAKAGAILARLPPNARAMYASAEHLIAAFTTQAIPLGDAQLVWQNQTGQDDVVACVFVKQPDPGVPSPSPSVEASGPRDKAPPMAAPNSKTVSAYLSLHRADGRWRLVVPMSAIDSIAKQLGAAAVPVPAPARVLGSGF